MFVKPASLGSQPAHTPPPVLHRASCLSGGFGFGLEGFMFLFEFAEHTF